MSSSQKYSTPPSSPRSTFTLLRDEVKQKANREWVEAKIEPLKEDVDEAKQLAIKAMKKSGEHECYQEDNIKSLNKAMNGWRNIKIGAVVSVGVLLVGGLAQYFAFKDSVEDTQDEMVEVKADVAEVKGGIARMKSDIQQVKIIVEEEKEGKKKNNKKQLEEIKAAIKDVMDARADTRSRNRNR